MSDRNTMRACVPLAYYRPEAWVGWTEVSRETVPHPAGVPSTCRKTGRVEHSTGNPTIYINLIKRASR